MASTVGGCRPAAQPSRSPTTAPASAHCSASRRGGSPPGPSGGPRAENRRPARGRRPATSRGRGVPVSTITMLVSTASGSTAAGAARPPPSAKRGPRHDHRPAGPGGGPARTPAAGGQDAGLPHPAAEPLAPDPSPSDPLRGAHQHRADRCTETLGEADAHGVEEPTVVGQRHPGGDVRVPQSGPVEVVAEAVLPAQPADRGELLDGLDRAAAEVVGVLHRDRRRRDQVGPGVRRDDPRRPRPASSRPRTDGKVRMVSPCSAAWAPISARAMCAWTSQTTSSPGSTSSRTPSRLASDPDAQNSPASCPSSAATRCSSAVIVGSSPYTSSPHRGGRHRRPHPGGRAG